MLHFGDLIQIPTIAIRGVPGRDAWSWPTHEVIESKARKQYTGKAPREFSLSLMLHVEFIAPRPTVTRLRQIADAAEVFQLWTSSGGYWGTYAIEGVDDRPIWTFPDGRIIAMACDVTLRDPGVEVETKVRPAALVTTAQDTVTTPAPEGTTGDPSDVTPAEIARI